MIFFLFLLLNIGFCVPPTDIPPHLLDSYTRGGTIPIKKWYIDGSYSDKSPRIFAKSEIDLLIKKAYRKENNYYGETDAYLYEALENFPIANKEVAILGSVEPWYESVVIAYGGRPTTIEYNKIETDDDRLSIMTVEEYQKNPKKFDIVISISSIEHDGLGRYGDPIHPNADLLTMQNIKNKMLKNDGILIVAVPVGQDCLCWNAHRIYGPIRLPILFRGWKILGAFGFHSANFNRDLGEGSHQPVFCLSR